MIRRRALITGLAASLAAPAIVRAGVLMPVRIVPGIKYAADGYARIVAASAGMGAAMPWEARSLEEFIAWSNRDLENALLELLSDPKPIPWMPA